MGSNADFQKTLLVGWSGCDWGIAHPLIEKGFIPQLENVVENGTSGTLKSYAPYLSSMLWNTILTGKHPDRHGILSEREWCAVNQRFQPISSDARSCSTLWDMVSRQNIPAHAVGWSATCPPGPLNGYCISDAFVQNRPSVSVATVFPQEKEAALAQVRMGPDEVDSRLLGLLIPDMQQLDQKRHAQHLGRLRIHLAELYSTHNAAIQVYATQPQGLFCVCYRFIEAVSRDFIQFHQSSKEASSDEEASLFGEVVNGAYRLQDLLLADLLKYSQPQTGVFIASEHGQAVPHSATRSHPLGMFAAVGPGIRSDHLVHGASVSDIAPTLLHYMDLPIGADMDGRVLTDLFAIPSSVSPRSSWDENRAGKPEGMAEECDVPLTGRLREERCRNLGTALLSLKRSSDALPALEEAFFLWPENIQTASQLIECQMQLGLLDEAEQSFQSLEDRGDELPGTRLLRAEIAYQREFYDDALEILDVASKSLESRASELRGLIMLKLERFDEAYACFNRASVLNPENPMARLGIARAHLRRKRYTEAEKAAQETLALRHEMPLAHLTLGQCREAGGHIETALVSYELALTLQPELITAQYGILRCRQKCQPVEELAFIRVSKDTAFSQEEAEATMKAKKKRRISELRAASRKRKQQWQERRNAERAPHAGIRQEGKSDAIEIRAPWPDEHDRIQALWKGRFSANASDRMIAVTSDPERIVAMATLLPSQHASSSTYTCRLDVLPRFQQGALPRRLLEALEQHHSEARHLSLSFCPKTEPWMQSVVESLGYRMRRDVELWKGTIEYMFKRWELARTHVEQRLAEKGLVLDVVPLNQADPQEVEMLVKDSGLLSMERVFTELERGLKTPMHHAALSCVIRAGTQPVGIALVSERDDKTILFDVRSVASFAMAISSLVNFRMLHYIGSRALGLGYQTVLFFSSDQDWRETRSMAQRGNCQSLQRQQQWTKIKSIRIE